MRLVSIAVGDAVDALLAKGKTIAAQILQAPEAEITFAEGAFSTASGASVDLWETAAASPDGLASFGDITNRAGGYPYGAHVCELEVDPETGYTDILRWTAVDDVGLAVNPLILHGQAHGAVAQGLGQALMESIHYDPETAQLLTGSFMDYAMPRAITTPPVDTIITEVPASSHPHGVRPGGEGGTTPALGVVINAIVDALSDYGVTHIEMPATPQRVWQAIQSAKQG
jgi:carbon-monoxide dehydrogenase large subunit